MQIVRPILFVLAVAAVVLCAWLVPLDAPASDRVDAGLKRALASFATARALNAVISVAQGTEVSAQPLGVGVNLAPGQALDPVNDMVEQFANLMLAASVSFGVQKMLIGIGSYWLVSLLLTAAIVAWAGFWLRKRPPPSWLTGLVVVTLLVRFAVPVTTLGSDWAFRQFLADDYAQSQRVIDTATGQTAALAPSTGTSTTEASLLDRMKEWLSKDSDFKARFDELKAATEQAVEHMVNLIVIFLLQTVVIPLLLLWGLYGLARRAMGWSAR